MKIWTTGFLIFFLLRIKKLKNTNVNLENFGRIKNKIQHNDSFEIKQNINNAKSKTIV